MESWILSLSAVDGLPFCCRYFSVEETPYGDLFISVMLVDVLFYSGEEVGAATGEPAPNSRGEDGRGLAWE
ncbi:hypothetical protein F2P81_021109 [Scophthalmus maximus]|uniref:Uncharacterized protein n=1 Tax=Scophthalmus maximus TaxID=52904 RepID=A0A6A4S4X5_SCOMX|nr:hypothetical protein F2P81_021109 [Scophthalmus maximus]